MIVSEYIQTLRDKPSPEYIQTLRDMGASERTIQLAMGEGRKRGRLRRWLGI